MEVELQPQPDVTPPIVERASDLDGRPSFEPQQAGHAPGSPERRAMDAAVLERILALETCPGCGHVASRIDEAFGTLDRARDLRADLLALPDHTPTARRYLYIAFLHGGDPLREGAWVLRAAWADEAAGLAEGGRRLHLRAADRLEAALDVGQRADEESGATERRIADAYRRGGAFVHAARICLRGLAPGACSDRERKLLTVLGSRILEGRTEPMTIGDADALWPEVTKDEGRVVLGMQDLVAHAQRPTGPPQRRSSGPPPRSMSPLGMATVIDPPAGASNVPGLPVRSMSPLGMATVIDPPAGALNVSGLPVRSMSPLGMATVIDPPEAWKRTGPPPPMSGPPNPTGPPAPELRTTVVGAPDRRARTLAEARFAATLRGCASCGAPPLSLLPTREEDGRLVLRGGCGFCNTLNVFEVFAEPNAQGALAPGREIGDARPSPIVSAIELLTEFDRLRPMVAVALAVDRPAEWDANTARRDRAITCVLELGKHIPPGAAAVPASELAGAPEEILGPNAEHTTRAWLDAERARLLAVPPLDEPEPPPPPPLADVLRALVDPTETPKDIGALEATLSTRLDPARLGASSTGNISFTPAHPFVAACEMRYLFDVHHDRPVASLGALRSKTLDTWCVTFHHGIELVDAALRAGYGVPREGDGHTVFGERFVVEPVGVEGGCKLHMFTRLPDWAVPPVDPLVRERVLAQLIAVAGASSDRASLARGGANLPTGCGIVRHVSGAGSDQRLLLELAPAMAAVELVELFAWKNAVWCSPDVHGTTWVLALVTGTQGDVSIVAAPQVGAWEVTARAYEPPKAQVVVKGGGPMGLRPVIFGDVIRYVTIG